MARKQIRLSELSPDELEDLVVDHTNAFFAEVKMVADKAAAQYSPVELAKRHPIATAGVAMAAAVFLLRLFKGGGRKGGGDADRGGKPSFFGSMLASIGGSVGGFIPQIAMLLISRWQAAKVAEEHTR